MDKIIVKEEGRKSWHKILLIECSEFYEIRLPNKLFF